MRAKILRALKRGTVIRVNWLDIMEDPSGNPDKASLTLRKTLGHVFKVKRDRGVDTLVLNFTEDEDGDQSEAGWICIPTSVIRDMQVLLEKTGEGDNDGLNNGTPDPGSTQGS